MARKPAIVRPTWIDHLCAGRNWAATASAICIAPLKTIAVFLLLLLLLALPLQSASAHPADMYAQNQALTFAPDGLHLDWKIVPGPILADAVWGAVAQGPNGGISQEAARAWVAPFLDGLSVSFDGLPLHPTETQSIHWPAGVDVLRTGEDAIGVSLLYRWPAAPRGTHAVQLHNLHLEDNTLNWFSLTAEQGLSFDQPSQNNGLLKLDVSFPAGTGSASSGASSSLTSWNSGTPNLPDFTGALSRMAITLSQPVQPASPPRPASTSGTNFSTVTSALTGLVKTQQLSPLFLLGAFLLSLALGSLHALTPGHGKALVGAYLVGSHGKTRDAVFLGTIVTITHTGSVLLLGLVTLFAAHYILPSLIVPWLEIVSGLLVIGFGLNLLIRRWPDLSRSFSLARNTDPAAPHGHSHSHAGSAAHDHSHVIEDHHHHPHDSHHGAGGHIHAAAAGDPGGQAVTPRSLLTLGISGGLVPCPDAIAILLVAVAVNRIPFGMLLIASFSIGLALVLIGIGIAMVKGVSLISRSQLLSRFAVYTPVISAIVVSGLGVGLTLSALNSLKFASAVARPAGAPSSQPASVQASPPTLTAGSVFDLQKSQLLYVASDSTGWDQLFMLPLSGGDPAQFTHEPSGITAYSISPDNKTILYTLYTTGGGTSIWALNADGTGKRLVLDCPQAECNFPQWYPDGRKMAYERLDNALNTTVPRFSIWWLDIATGKTQPVFEDQALASYAPQFSPDGKWLSYISSADNTLIAFDLKDGSTRSVHLGFQYSIPETWSPTGDAMLFGSQSQDNGPLHVRIYTLASAETTDLGAAVGVTDYSAAWSPDGSWIAIDRSLPTEASQTSNQVWLVKPDGTLAHLLLKEDGASYSSLNWSPDGRYLLYSRYSLESPTPGAASSASTAGTGRFDVYVTDIQTGESRLLVTGGDLPALLP